MGSRQGRTRKKPRQPSARKRRNPTQPNRPTERKESNQSQPRRPLLFSSSQQQARGERVVVSSALRRHARSPQSAASGGSGGPLHPPSTAAELAGVTLACCCCYLLWYGSSLLDLGNHCLFSSGDIFWCLCNSLCDGGVGASGSHRRMRGRLQLNPIWVVVGISSSLLMDQPTKSNQSRERALPRAGLA